MKNKKIVCLLLTCLGYWALGFGIAVQMFGFKAGLSPNTVLIIFLSCLIFYAAIVFTAMDKLKSFLFKEDEIKTPHP